MTVSNCLHYAKLGLTDKLKEAILEYGQEKYYEGYEKGEEEAKDDFDEDEVISDASTSILINEIRKRHLSKSEVNELRKIIGNDDNFQTVTVIDEMKLESLINIFKNKTLEEIQAFENS